MVGHPTILRGLALPGLAGDPARPVVLSILEQDFLPWFLGRLETPEGQAQLATRNALARRNPANEARLFQPVHRTFNIVAVEVACLTEGLPPLDPRKVLGGGVTLRRRVPAASGSTPGVYRDLAAGLYGWMRQEDRVLGWRRVFSTADPANAPDPDPGFRKQAAEGRNGRVLGRLPLDTNGTAEHRESHTPLFLAPEALCRKLGKTVLYGYLPVTSDERSEADGPPPAPFARADVAARLPAILWSAARRAATPAPDLPTLPPANTTLAASQAAAPSDALSTLLAGLRYLAQETGLFLEDEAGDPAAQLRTWLRSITVTLHGASGSSDFYSFLKAANTGFVERNPEVTSVALPVQWPAISEVLEAALTDAALTAVSARWTALSPGETRFQDPAARYELQAFVRVDRSDCGCPPKTVWTRPSIPIEIVPWFEGGEAPPPIIELPSPSALRGKIRPNVAFKVPEEIQKFMSGLKLDKLMDGEKPEDKAGWGMICGFSIPILTICAFIVLQIFLVLFHILFWWLPFIRICIPFPRKEGN